MTSRISSLKRKKRKNIYIYTYISFFTALKSNFWCKWSQYLTFQIPWEIYTTPTVISDPSHDFGAVRTTRNFVWFAKNSVNVKPFLVRTIFCTHQNFCKRSETSKIPSTSFGGCKNFVRRENPSFLDIHPSLYHQISQHMDYEAKSLSKSSNDSLPIRIFLRNKVSGKWRWCRWISNQDSAGRGNIQYGWKRPLRNCARSNTSIEDANFAVNQIFPCV